MITKKDLIETIKNFPDEAIIYVEADHGQTSEKSNSIYTTNDKDLPYYGCEIDWDVEVEGKDVTAILILA